MAEATILLVAKSIISKLDNDDLSSLFPSVPDDTTLHDLQIIRELLIAIIGVLQNADPKEYTREDVNLPLRLARSVVYEIDDFLVEVEASFLLFSRITICSNISDFRIKLDNLWKDLQNLRIKQSRKTAACVNLLSSREIIGREGDKMMVINRILAAGDVRDLTVVVVIGMSGIGKTALAKLVFRDLAMDCFDAKVWVSAKSYISIERILQDVIQAATGEISSTTCRNELESKIQSVFKNQRFLLVIDDVDMGSSPFWMELKSIVDVGRTGSVILITSKDEEVASIVQCVEIYYHYIGGISDSACWSIIKGLAFSEGEEERYPKLCEIGKSIARKCGRLPFVAVCLGRLLQGERDEEEWLYIDKMDVASLQKSNGIPLLKLACDKLPSYLKPCFAFLALNQGDIDCANQVFFWNGLGLLQVGDEKDDIGSCGQTCLMELLSRSIIHDPVWTFDRKIISCKIHDDFKKLVMEVLGEDLAVVSCNNLTVSVLSRHIIWGYEKPNALFDKEFPEELLKAKKARTFRFGYPMDRISQPFLEGIISNMPYLHILDLGYSHFEVLPSSVGELKHLRVLNISFNPIIKSLPHTISKLSKLQAFFLQGCEQLEEIPSNIQNLINLKCFTVTTSQKSLLGMEFNHLPALQELQFLSCKKLVSLWECGDAGRLISLQRLRFHNCPQLGFLPNSMSLLLALRELVIADCQMLDFDEGKGLNALKCLESLEISGVPLLTYLPQSIQSAAKSLHYFSLRDCIGLVELPSWLQSFTYIRSFVIYNCPKLLTLPDGIFFITSLEKLEIRGCPLLSRWCVTIEGFSLIEHIPRIEIDGRCITRKMKKQELSLSEDDETSNTAQISQISYLPGREVMKLHFHLFPSDYEFERETLVLLWIAAGYFRAGFMEESARRYFDGFVEEGYIILSGIDKFSGTSKYIINVDKAVNVANDGLYTLLRDENMEGEITKYQHISVVSNYINQKTFETLKKFNELRTVMFIHNYGPALNQVPSDIFLALPCMETLDLSGSHITELPGSIGNVTQLRYLDLSFTLIDRLPETIGRLVELQTLKLNGCDKLYNLPKGLKKLIRLRHLYFDVLGQLSFMPRGIGALTELRTLSAFIVDAEKGCNLSELRNMNNLSGYCCISGLENASDGDASEPVLLHKRHLTHIQLRWDGYGATNDGIASSPVSYLEPHSCLEKLEVACYPNSRLPGWIFDEKFESLTSITFRKCENTSLGIYFGKLPNLKYLDIIQMNKVHIIDHFNHSDPGYVSFPKLEKLTINGMFRLAKWAVVSDRSFPLLSKFSIKNCPNIPELNFMAYLGSLEYLEISHCKALESLCPRGLLLSKKLKTLAIDSCPLLKKFAVNAEDWHKIKHVPEIWFDLVDMHSPEEDSHHSDSENENENENENEHKEDEGQLESSINDHLYDQLEHAMIESENARRKAFEESMRRRKAEKEALDTICKAKKAERLYYEQLRLRKASQENLAKAKEELENMKNLWIKVSHELHETMDQKLSLETLIEDSNSSVKELEDKLFSAVELLQKYKNERDESQIERDNALREADKLRKQLDEGPSISHVPVFFSDFSFSDLEKATNYFDPSWKIGEGGYGSIYKGFLRHTEVAIKIFHPDSTQGPQEFNQEVDVLSKLRHPNMVTLIGACPESWALVYEYLPGGSLEDRLVCKDNASPLPWQTRIRIATELCSVLIFLHSSRPSCIIHGDIKPANILLDHNFVSKLSDFGICRVVSNGETSMEQTRLFFTEPKGTFTYMDPEFLSSGELTPKSDVYSFGIILLRLLTGKSALGIAKEVEYALAKGTLDTLLDPSGGDWPFVQAEQLARMALRCCDKNRVNRPDLGSDVWRVLEPMKSSCQSLSMLRLESCNQAPTYFMCPIFQEIMEDPHIAADGVTYEAEAIRGWLDSGHDSSPMTNVKLANHNLIPNRALRSAIQEWLQPHPSA